MNDTDVDRTITHDDQKTVIESNVSQEVDHETFMDMFEEKLTRQRQLSRQVRDMTNQIEDLLDEKERDLQLMHAIDEDQEQTNLPSNARGNPVNSIGSEAINSYTNLVEAKQQREQKEKELEDVEEDLEELGPAAETLAQAEDLEVPSLWTEKVKDIIQGDDDDGDA